MRPTTAFVWVVLLIFSLAESKIVRLKRDDGEQGEDEYTTEAETVIVDPRNEIPLKEKNEAESRNLVEEVTESHPIVIHVPSVVDSNDDTADTGSESEQLPEIEPREGAPEVVIFPAGNDITEELSDSSHVQIEPRDDGPEVETLEDGETGNDVAKRVAWSRFEDLDRQQQNFKYVQCNDVNVPLAGTSATNFLVVQSPYFPANYPTYLWCEYKMNVPANSQVIVKVLAMEVDCPMDYVQFGVQGQAPLMTLCPLQNVGKTYTMLPKPDGYTFVITFMSDKYVTYRGFQMLVYLNATAVDTPTTIAPQTTNCTCGRYTQRSLELADGEAPVDADGRIVGGFVALPNAYPYQIGLMFRTSTKPFCGGTLISPNYVLTAAHCTVNYANSTNLRVSVGDVNFQIPGDGEQYINVTKVLVHPNYNSKTQDSDFSILQLASPATTSKAVAFACLPPDVNQAFDGTMMVISGWGTVQSNGTQSPDLKAAFVSGMTNAACNATKYSKITSITNNMICATAPNTDACQGDSGGPMVAVVDGKATLVGVVSFGVGCANPDYPGVYARVTAQKDWILANTDAAKCQN